MGGKCCTVWEINLREIPVILIRWIILMGVLWNPVPCSKSNRAMYDGQLGPLPTDTVTVILQFSEMQSKV